MIRRALTTAAAALPLLLGMSTPAQASGWVANSCAVRQALHAVMDAPHPVTKDGTWVRFIPCGTGSSEVLYVTAGPNTPYYVNPEGPAAPFCMQAGQRYYPDGNGAVLTPTVRCR